MSLYLINLNLILYHLNSGGHFSSLLSPLLLNLRPLLEKDGLVFVEVEEKANVLNDFFRDQTLLNDHDAVLPEITPYLVERYLSSLVFSPDEVKLILKSLLLGKLLHPTKLVIEFSLY